MDLELFKQKMNEQHITLMSLHDMQKISKQSYSKLSCDTNGSHNLLICMTEMAELSEQISCYLLNSPDIYHFIEEYADVQLSLYYICDVCKLNVDLDDVTNPNEKSVLTEFLNWNGCTTDKTAILIECQRYLSILTHDIGDYLRNKTSNDIMIQSITNVQRALYYLQHVCALQRHDIHKAMHIKMERLQTKLIQTGIHQ